jgi:hypothetical protein
MIVELNVLESLPFDFVSPRASLLLLQMQLFWSLLRPLRIRFTGPKKHSNPQSKKKKTKKTRAV